MYQNNILKGISSDVEKSGEKIEVRYREGEFTGVCIYEEVIMGGVNKPIKQKVLLLVDSDMGDIIEYLHKKSPMSEKDFQSVTMGIREDSLERVKNYLSSL